MNKNFLFSTKIATILLLISGITAGCGHRNGEDASENQEANPGSVNSGSSLDGLKDEKAVEDGVAVEDETGNTDIPFEPLNNDSVFTLAEAPTLKEEIKIWGTNINGEDEISYSPNDTNVALVNPTLVYSGDTWNFTPDNVHPPKIHALIKHNKAAIISSVVTLDLNSEEPWKMHNTPAAKNVLISCDINNDKIIQPETEQCNFLRKVYYNFDFDVNVMNAAINYEKATFKVTETFTHKDGPLACNGLTKKMQMLDNMQLKKCGAIGVIFAKLREKNAAKYNQEVYFQNMTSFERSATLKVKRKE